MDGAAVGDNGEAPAYERVTPAAGRKLAPHRHCERSNPEPANAVRISLDRHGAFRASRIRCALHHALAVAAPTLLNTGVQGPAPIGAKIRFDSA